jgi:hypothetical protein
MGKLATFWAWIDSKARAKILFDKSAWLLIAPVVAGIYAIDPALAKTLGQWSIIALAFAGLSIIISRLIFPHISIQELADSARDDKNIAAAIVSASLILFVSVVMLSVVLWAKS